MIKHMNFTIGNALSGYKTVELFIDGDRISRKILRNGLLDGDKKNSPVEKISHAALRELEALNIFSWEENYSSSGLGLLWHLKFAEGEKIYCGRGCNAYPPQWERFADWLDALFPDMAFVNRNRLERVAVDYFGERLVIERREKTLTIEKSNSNHVYDAGDDAKKIFGVCQKFFDGIERNSPDVNFSAKAKFELIRHDGTTETFETPYTENFLPDLSKFIDAVQSLANDLSSEIFVPQTAAIAPRQGKYIFCKVQFPGGYKRYTYSTDDETLAAGDIVDVPVGRNNEIVQARIVDIGYFEEYEAPFAVDKIKKIIGKHIADEWENN